MTPGSWCFQNLLEGILEYVEIGATMQKTPNLAKLMQLQLPPSQPDQVGQSCNSTGNPRSKKSVLKKNYFSLKIFSSSLEVKLKGVNINIDPLIFAHQMDQPVSSLEPSRRFLWNILECSRKSMALELSRTFQIHGFFSNFLKFFRNIIDTVKNEQFDTPMTI